MRRSITDDERRSLHTANSRADMYLIAQQLYAAGVSLASMQPEFEITSLSMHQKIRIPARKL